MIWTESGDKCRTTCDHVRYGSNVLKSSNPMSEGCKSNFFEGCSCPIGLYYREDQTCTTREGCGCEFQNRVYDEEYVRRFETGGKCQNCVCRENRWSCSDRDDCVKQCKTYGAGHVDTFDGLKLGLSHEDACLVESI